MEEDPHERITHIERCQALMKATKDTVHKAVLADLVRYLESRLKQMAEAAPP